LARQLAEAEPLGKILAQTQFLTAKPLTVADSALEMTA
jgi:hypothetical protein